MLQRMKLRLAMPVATGIFFVSTSAFARSQVELRYERSAQAVTCPDESALRIEVARRLGYDPFVEKSEDGRRIVATVDRTKTGDYRGLVRLDDEDGTHEGAREIEAVDCAELVSSMALTASVLLEPLGGRHRRVEPPPPLHDAHDLPPIEKPPPPPPPPPAPKENGTSFALRFGAMAVGSVAAAPTPAIGFKALAGFGFGPAGQRVRWSLDGEARFDLESGATDASNGTRTSLAIGALAPCRHFGSISICLVLDVGALRGQVSETIPGAHEQSSFYSALGARVGLEIPIGAGLALAAQADLVGVLTPTTLRAGDQDLWTTPPLDAALSLGVIGSFL